MLTKEELLLAADRAEIYPPLYESCLFVPPYGPTPGLG